MDPMSRRLSVEVSVLIVLYSMAVQTATMLGVFYLVHWI